MKKILIIQGHPDPDRLRFGYKLSDVYKDAALMAGNEVNEIFVADLDFDLLRSSTDFNEKPASELIQSQQQLIAWADHIVIFYPLWLGGMPALLKGFFEQVLRPGFAFSNVDKNFPKKMLSGKTAHVFVTMGMPSFIYQWVFHAYSVRSLQRNILGFCGIKPVRMSLIGGVETMSKKRREQWFIKIRNFGIKAI